MIKVTKPTKKQLKAAAKKMAGVRERMKEQLEELKNNKRL